MIVVKLYGGLGNQLFQYSMGRHLAIKYDTLLNLDVDWFKSAEKPELYKLNRHFELGNFSLKFSGFYSEYSIKSKLLKKISGLKIVAEKVFDENGYEYVFAAGNNIILDGYWGSYLDYLFNPDFKKIISKELTLKHGILPARCTSYSEQIINCENPVSISVRRGDYTKIGLFGTLDMDYYHRAIEKINIAVQNPKYFIFSDDMEWVKQNFSFLKNKVFVETGNLLCDFSLIRQCRHNIIANSSFSWWAAFLNNNETKLVIAPKHWFLLDAKAQAFHEQSKCIPIQWTRL